MHVPARKEADECGPEGAAGEAVDDEVYAGVEHEEKVVDAGEEAIQWDLVIWWTQQDEENETFLCIQSKFQQNKKHPNKRMHWMRSDDVRMTYRDGANGC